ncbi:replication factor C large subunit [Candidatus Woesearchaeota archaeon]|nr:replication factor C large subunit [Candidatus Woesearchaeota archaeon]
MPSSSQPWTKKYAPQKLSDIKGQDKAVQRIREFVLNYKKQKKKALLLYGPTGTGKTAALHAAAQEFDFETIELNASDFRTPEQIQAVQGNAIKQRSLFGKEKLIIIDEVDGLSGTQDRGGAGEIAKLMEISPFPIVLTANDPEEDKLKALKAKAELLSFEPLPHTVIAEQLEHISKHEGITATTDDLKHLARRTGGDMRAAITDFQILTIGSKQLKHEDIQMLGDRDKEEELKEALFRIFKTMSPEIALAALDNVDEEYNEVMLWIDENLPQEYQLPQERAKAYDMLSKADIMQRRIRRWQHWRFLVYIKAYISMGIALSKDAKHPHQVEYQRTTRLLQIWKANMTFAKRKDIAAKIGEICHTSSKRAIKDILPYLGIIFAKNKYRAEELFAYLDLNDEEIEWVRKRY